MTQNEMLARIEEVGIIPAVRTSTAAEAVFASEAVFRGGIPVVEITMTTPGAIDVISQLMRGNPEVIVGAGTVLDVDTAGSCIEAGASFLTSTGLDPELVEFARAQKIPMIPGALTPTEVIVARKAGAAFIKIFPCASMGGPSYIRALRGPFPDVRFIASGGVTQNSAAEYIRVGTNVLGIGRELLPAEAIRGKNSDWIYELSRRFLEMVKQARSLKGPNGKPK